MKKYIIIPLLCILIYGCEKKPFDYRTKYIGDYTFVVQSSSWDPLNGQHDTTYTMEGEIDYGSGKNAILISFSGSSSTKIFTLFEDGTIQARTIPVGCSGEFESVNKITYSCHWASPAHHASRTVKGEKK